VKKVWISVRKLGFQVESPVALSVFLSVSSSESYSAVITCLLKQWKVSPLCHTSVEGTTCGLEKEVLQYSSSHRENWIS